MNEESKAFTIAKWVFGLGIAWAISPFILGALKGIVGLAACVVVGVVVIEAWPLFQFSLRKTIINIFKWQARKDPIGSAQAVEIEKQKELALYREETTSIDADTRSFERMVEDAARQYPDDPETERLKQQLQMLQDTVADRRQTEVEFEKALTAYRAGIKKMQVMWAAAQAGAKASKRASMSKQQYERLVAETAFDTVQKAMDSMSARLAESRARADAQRAALPPHERLVSNKTIDFKPEKVPAPRRMS